MMSNVDWSHEHINTYTCILTYILHKCCDFQWLFVFYLISVKAFLAQAKDDFDKKWDEPPQVTFPTALIVFSILLGFLHSAYSLTFQVTGLVLITRSNWTFLFCRYKIHLILCGETPKLTLTTLIMLLSLTGSVVICLKIVLYMM